MWECVRSARRERAPVTASAWSGISVGGASGAAPARPGHARGRADRAAADRSGGGGLQSSLVSGDRDTGGSGCVSDRNGGTWYRQAGLG